MKQKGGVDPKMEDIELKCPLCCDKTFDTKPALIEHLNNILVNNLVCPICMNKCSSLADLVKHLSLDSCELENAVSSKKLDPGQKSIAVKKKAATKTKLKKLQEAESSQAAKNKTAEQGSAAGDMYVEILDKQQLKLVKGGDLNRYVLVTSDDAPLKSECSSKIITKQNNDGTISLTAVEDIKTESKQHAKDAVEEEGDEIYTCNTCGVSFTSVLEHIQNYHNDQEVVVEEPLVSMDSPTNEMPIEELEDPLNSSTANSKSGARRMITETGDIVEEPVYTKNASISLGQSNAQNSPEPQIKEEVVDKLGRSYTRRYVVVDKMNEAVVKDSKPPKEEKKNGPYHKVVLKEMVTGNGEKMKVFHCMSCNAYVANLEEFKSRPCKQLKYTCPRCPVSYENHRSLCAHMKVHKMKHDTILGTMPPATQFECEVCNTQFQTHKSLKLHKRMHDPIKVRPIEFPVEGANGGEVSNDQFVCSVCHKLIPIDYRAVHVASHREPQEFHCDVCNKRFDNQSYLDMHMSVHSAEKTRVEKEDKSLQYKCLYCDRRFARPHEKVKHERIHTGEKPHSCEICGKSFRVSYCLTLHMRTHTGARPYECRHCGKRFKAHSVYNHHLLTHSDVRAYKCNFCPKAFKTSVQLAGHKNSHTKPFSCQHCNRPFASLYAVRVHTETHNRVNNLKFSCNLCGASYARAFALKDHMKQAHSCDSEETDKVEQMETSEKEVEWVTPDVMDDTAELKGINNEVDIPELAAVS